MNQDGNRQVDNERKKQEEQYNSFLYKFQQQIIDAWKPVPYTKNNVILYVVLTVVCITIGLALILTVSTTPEIEKKYDDDADGDGSLNIISFELTQTLQPPVFLYYGFTNYYQNHRRYLKYFSPDQMAGTTISATLAAKACGDNANTNKQIGAVTSVNGNALDEAAIAHPCGQRARSYIKLKPEIDSIVLKYSNGTNVDLVRTGISWPDDLKSYKNSDNLNNQVISNLDESWLVWFRPAAKSSFYKLHSRILTDLPAGSYSFQVLDKFDVSFGSKNFYLSKANYMGNKDYFLGIAFLVLGGGSLIVLIIFVAKCITEMRSKSKPE